MGNYVSRREEFCNISGPQNDKETVTDCVGTLRLNRKNIPTEVKTKKLKKGETICQHSGPVTVMKWCDKKLVTMISTYHDDSQTKVTVRGKEIEKPKTVVDYNHNMGGIDMKDQTLQMYLIERKRMRKWYHKLFRRLLNASVLNSLILFRQNTKTNIEHLSFRILLVEGLFAKYATGETRVTQPGRHASDNTVPRLTERHFLRRLTGTGKKARLQRRCVVCTGLCLDDCFEAYHTKLNF
ncbi:hypothetical protein B7P43_G13906 [Cryptotermes secundus]|uniref:PiggyBac transposable element-derived protein domain-containing protein n=1 Tax=Cryptotermes secundus TaxID=105785 RepID=A0A2J7QKE2_9NEOP|nr:hypothetical protein B7P43_G13906 [Cryptotermes secundus]